MGIKFDEECLKPIVKGADLAIECVKRTYGPNAKCCAIKTPYGVRISKDGATCVHEVNSNDPYEQIGIDLIKEASIKTAQDIGDGSSTVCILTGAIIDNLSNSKITLAEIQAESNKLLKKLKAKTKPVEDREGYLKVATLSANNDEAIGNIVADAFDKVGKDGIVQFELSENPTDSIEYTKGFRLDNGVASTRFLNPTTGVCELNNVYVYVSDTKMEEVKEVLDLADNAVRHQQALLLIAPGFDSEITMFLHSNRDKLASCTMITPYYRTYRDIISKDIRTLLGPSSICKKVVLDTKHAVFSGYESDTAVVEQEVQALKQAMLEKKMLEADLKFNRKRLANYTSGIATIYIGGYTDSERKEKYDRYEDAIRAVEAAIAGGVVPGGGKALSYIATKYTNNKHIKEIFTTPYRILAGNDNYLSDSSLWRGVNLKTLKRGDAYKLGVIEPYLVVETVLNNAIATASMVLNCACAIINEK